MKKICSARHALTAFVAVSAIFTGVGINAPHVAFAQEAVETTSGTESSQDAVRFIVTFNEMPTVDENHRMGIINSITKEFNADSSLVRKSFDGSYVVKLDPPVPAERVPSLKGALESKAEIHTADIDLFIKNELPDPSARFESQPPNDPGYRQQWYLDGENSAQVKKAWDLGHKGNGVTVAVVDTGITSHPDLNEKLLPGIDMIDDPEAARDSNGRDDDPQDEGDWVTENQCGPGSRAEDSSWHGTHVSGIIGAVQNNHIGVSGVAPDTQIVPVRVLGACGGYLSDIADGIAWAAGENLPGAPENAHPAKVINLSLGGDGVCERPYQRAIDAAHRRGSVVVIAAGNENENTDNKTPANCRNAITIGATGPEGYRSNFSNYGRDVDLGAPGGNTFPEGLESDVKHDAAGIFSTINTGRTVPERAAYGMMDGTSMATPVVSGVVSMMLDANPNLTPDEVERILKGTTQEYREEPDQPEFGNSPDKTRNLMGTGIVDARAAVCAAIRTGGGECE